MTLNDAFSLTIAVLALAFAVYANVQVTKKDREIQAAIKNYDRMIQKFKSL